MLTQKRAEKPQLSLFDIHKKFGWFLFMAGLITVCLINVPPPYALWHIVTGAVLGAISFCIAAMAIDSRSNLVFKSVILGFSVLFHTALLDGYRYTGDDYTGAIIAHVVFIAIFVFCYKPSNDSPAGAIRNAQGAFMYTPTEVARLVGATTDDAGNLMQDCFNLASIFLPFMMFSKHSCTIGMSETGKSIWHSIMQKAFFAKAYTKGILHDYASNMTAKLIGMGVDIRRIIKTNVFDRMGFGWLISEDAVGKSACKELGKIPFPINQNKGGNDYFPRTAGDIVGSVIYTLYRLSRDAGNEPCFDWSDVLNCCLSRERIYAVLSLYPDTKAAFSYLKSDGETNDSLMSTVRLGLQEFESIAALGHRAIEEGRIFSAKRWINSNQIILLGRESKRAKKAMALYNAAIVDMLVRTILSREVSDITPEPYIGIFLDELANLGKIQDLVELTREARRHGVSMNIANQDLLSLQEKYGRGEFASVTGQIKNWIFLALSDPNEQKLAADAVGKIKYEKLEESETTGISDNGTQGRSKTNNTTYSWKDKEEYLVMPSEFQNLSRVNFDRNPALQQPMELVAKIDTRFNFRVSLSPPQLLSLLPPKNKEAEHLNYNSVPPEWEELEPLTIEDFERLSLPPDIFDEDDGDKDDDIPFIPV